MYSKAAEEEDKKMADRWQKDADGILIFVSPRVDIFCIFTHPGTLDWSILRRRCRAACRNSPEPDPQQSGYLRILSRKYLSDSRRPECNTHTYTSPYR
jgi:hypothetical protein